MSERRELSPALAPFRMPMFRGLWSANVLSTIGGYVNDVGAAWLMTSLSTSPLLVSLVQVASNAPFFLLALPGGALGDILDKRKLLLVTQNVMMVLSALLGVLTLLGLISPVSLLLILFTVEVFDALAGPAWQTLIPEMVGPKEMRAAITLNSVGMNVARAVGPALGGAIVAIMATSGPAFLVNAVSFVAVIVFLWRWKRRVEPSGLPAERLLGAMRVGVRYVRFAPRFRATLVRIGAFMLFASALPTLLPVIARSYLHRGPGAYGVLLGFMGVGAVMAVPVLQRAQRFMKLDVLLAVATVISGCVELAIGGVHQIGAVCGIMFVAGIAWVTVMSSMNNAAQSVLPAWVRARAISVYLMVFFGALTAGGILWGVIATRAGAPMAMSVAGSGMFASLLLIPSFRLIDFEKLDLNPSLHWPAPILVHPPSDQRGPALITVEYRIAAENAQRFVQAMQERRRALMRTGAFRWGLFNDTEDQTRFVETFLSESWAEHVRQHKRITNTDREADAAIEALQMGSEKPVVRHLIYTDMSAFT
jgi:MFS family permease